MLKSLGFKVKVVLNGVRTKMRQGNRWFHSKIGPGVVALAYFSGHGLAHNGENYMTPVDFNAKQAYEVEDEDIALRSLLLAMEERDALLNILIADMCRSDPGFRSLTRSGNRGLAPVHTPKGSLIAFATAPGSVARDDNPTNPDSRNGLYTEQLLNWMQKPNMKLDAETEHDATKKGARQRHECDTRTANALGGVVIDSRFHVRSKEPGWRVVVH